MLGKALDKVNDLQNNADEMMKRLAAGEVKDIHRVMIAVEEASLSLQLTMQIRSKIIDAYQEIMRMPV
ncbi:MAG: flagellar hook-basal body complex protein FliE [Armatimonadetes bacterium CG07_land_8_20_14_0_80_40_9]|nr:MAG: flagellar hook-basal body complex protein FliE [Armatimonadetes bacterium CG07_land_8_20_14_0_80_40_9]